MTFELGGWIISENYSEMIIELSSNAVPGTEAGSGFDELSISFHDPYVPTKERKRRSCRVSRDVAKAEEGWCAVRYGAFQHGTEPRLSYERKMSELSGVSSSAG